MSGNGSISLTFPKEGVLPSPTPTATNGETYKYESKTIGGKRSKKMRKGGASSGPEPYTEIKSTPQEVAVAGPIKGGKKKSKKHTRKSRKTRKSWFFW
jgi:hypothetical protein